MFHVGIDGGAVVWDGAVLEERVDAVASTGARWVRINFRLDAWGDVGEPGWFEAYDQIVDAYRARGIAVYGLINDEAVGGDWQTVASDEFVWGYVGTAIAIMDHFKDRVRVWELFNEPNDWAGGTSPRMPADWMAVLLQETYLAVKRDHAGEPCWDRLTLVSGPLFSFDGTDASDYLDAVYSAGRFEKAWDYTHEVTGSFPLDAIGYHVYVHQGDASLGDVAGAVDAWVNAIDGVVQAHEGAGKPIWVSEMGWRADVVGADVQADRMETAFGALAANPAVAGGVWFQLQDFSGETWGVFGDGALDDTTRRPSADRLGQIAAALEPDSAVLEDECAPTPQPDPDPDPEPDPEPGETASMAGGCDAGGGGATGPLLLVLLALTASASTATSRPRRARSRTSG